MGRRICSERNILICLYLTIFLLPLSSWLFYFALVPAALLSMGDIFLTKRKVNYGGKWGWFGGGFLVCSFLSVSGAADFFFSVFNCCFLPLAYAFLYVLISTYFAGEEEKRKALYVFLAGAVCVVIWEFIQYADAGCMARDLNAEGWVDPERFPLLRRRMFSTLGNPNLFGAYLLMLISVFAPFALGERNNKRKILLAGFLFILSVCLALTYSRGAWISLAGIVLGLAVFYGKRFGLVFLAVPLILFFYHGQVAERFISLFSGEDTSLSLRLALWESTIVMIEEHPLLGVGWGGITSAVIRSTTFYRGRGCRYFFHAHDSVPSVIPAEVGIPGGISVLFFFGQGDVVMIWQRERDYETFRVVRHASCFVSQP
ncbi:MAG: O-antigen ligase family protein [Dialister invisus]